MPVVAEMDTRPRHRTWEFREWMEIDVIDGCYYLIDNILCIISQYILKFGVLLTVVAKVKLALSQVVGNGRDSSIGIGYLRESPVT